MKATYRKIKELRDCLTDGVKENELLWAELQF